MEVRSKNDKAGQDIPFFDKIKGNPKKTVFFLAAN
jgi:hypothetical protein